tara:strand:+ start:109 stop:516 length:408 start_codon:yes stop_codon:yes gene_type:complete
MIDTDKYEGHTPAPWEEVHFNWKNRTSPNGANIHTNDYVVCIKDVADVVFVNDGETMDANWNLIKDAPLFLAEVKRLRMYEVAWKMLYDTAIEEGRETRTRTWKEIMELVRSDVVMMVGHTVFDEWAKRTIGGFE